MNIHRTVKENVLRSTVLGSLGQVSFIPVDSLVGRAFYKLCRKSLLEVMVKLFGEVQGAVTCGRRFWLYTRVFLETNVKPNWSLCFPENLDGA